MTPSRVLDIHRNWADWFGMLVGVLIALSPWLSGEMGSQAMMVNAIFVGVVVFVLAEYEAADLHRWQEVGEVALGSWVTASPFIFGYSEQGTLRFWHFVLGAVVVILSVLELWHDWRLSDKELTSHGDAG
jgi:hypothetical protein